MWNHRPIEDQLRNERKEYERLAEERLGLLGDFLELRDLADDLAQALFDMHQALCIDRDCVCGFSSFEDRVGLR
jgi:hypothetical protein